MANISGLNAPVLDDQEYVEKIIDSFTAVDNHDHTTGKGVPIGTTALADGSVTEVKLATGSVTETKLGTGSVTETKLGALAVTGAKIAASTITGDKLAAVISGDHDYTGNVVLNDDVIIPDDNDAAAGNVVELATTGKGSIRLTGAVTALSSIAGGVDGKVVFLINATGGDFPIIHENTVDLTLANRIDTGNAGLEITLKAGGMAVFKYDGTTQRWRVSSGGGGGGAPQIQSFLSTTLDLILTASPEQIWRHIGTSVITLTSIDATSLPVGGKLTVMALSNDYPVTIPSTLVGVQNGDAVLHVGGAITYVKDQLLGLVEVSRNGL